MMFFVKVRFPSERYWLGGSMRQNVALGLPLDSWSRPTP